MSHRMTVFIQNHNLLLLEELEGLLEIQKREIEQDYRLSDISFLRGSFSFCVGYLPRSSADIKIVIVDTGIFRHESLRSSLLLAGADSVYEFKNGNVNALANFVVECIQHNFAFESV